MNISWAVEQTHVRDPFLGPSTSPDRALNTRLPSFSSERINYIKSHCRVTYDKEEHIKHALPFSLESCCEHNRFALLSRCHSSLTIPPRGFSSYPSYHIPFLPLALSLCLSLPPSLSLSLSLSPSLSLSSLSPSLSVSLSPLSPPISSMCALCCFTLSTRHTDVSLIQATVRAGTWIWGCPFPNMQ